MLEVDSVFFMVLNRVLDGAFAIDMILQFFLMYRDPETGLWVGRQNLIIKNYLTGWFVVDIVAIFPFGFIYQSVSGDSNNMLNTLRIIRLLRGLKLIRLIRMSRIWARWDTSIEISHIAMMSTKLVFVLTFCSHWTACSLGIFTFLEGAETSMASKIADRALALRETVVEDVTPWSVYCSSLFWATQ